MNPTFPITTVTDSLLNEVAHSSVSMEPVFFAYAGVIAAAALLWTIGVVAFGKPRTAQAASDSVAASPEQRVTPVVP